MRLNKIYTYVLSIPKTLYFNFMYFDFKDAIKLPVFVSKNVILKQVKGNIIIKDSISTGMIRIGFGDIGIFDKSRSKSIWDVCGIIVFNGNASIGHGSKINISGKLILGKNFKISAESTIICKKKLAFGDNCLVSWENLIMDTDFHKVYSYDKKLINCDRSIEIGNNVWIGCRCTILKGTRVKDNIVIAANTSLHSSFDFENAIIGGNPISILKNNISWGE